MTIRKLVERNGRHGLLLEIDPVKLKRVATEFKEWLLTVDPNNDPFGFLTKDLPIVESALNGQMTLPYKGWKPHNWEIREGLLPERYHDFSASFYNTIRGQPEEIAEVIMKDGRYYSWVEFEDPEDVGSSDN